MKLDILKGDKKPLNENQIPETDLGVLAEGDMPVLDNGDRSLILEAALTDVLGDSESIQSFTESTACNEMVKMGLLSEKSIVRLSKQAQKDRNISIAVLTLAKKNKDPLYRKWLTATTIKRAIFGKLSKKYKSGAQREAKEMLKRAKTAKKKK